MTATLDPKLLDKLCVYQDVVLAGRTVLRGKRDSATRWNMIRPLVGDCRTLLDVGSNFGWFGLQACAAFPECVVASVEADERSAAVQRRVLESHEHRRQVLLTHRAGAGMAETFANAGQRFDAVLCLSVLHWMRDHRAFLTRLAPLAGRIFIEQPDPSEEGAGIERIRREIGPIKAYLREIFPDRTLLLVGRLPGDRSKRHPRELWMVGPPPGWSNESTRGLDLAAMLSLLPSWPPRDWWQAQIESLESHRHPSAPQVYRLTGSGIESAAATGDGSGLTVPQLARRLNRLPQRRLWNLRHGLYRRMRRAASSLLNCLA
jgi:hypothetical protein